MIRFMEFKECEYEAENGEGESIFIDPTRIESIQKAGFELRDVTVSVIRTFSGGSYFVVGNPTEIARDVDILKCVNDIHRVQDHAPEPPEELEKIEEDSHEL